MKIYAIICLAAAIALAQSPISVEAFDEQGNNPSQLTLRLRLTNNSPDTLENVRTRYFLQFETGRVLNVAPYYLAGASLSLDTLGDYIAVNIDVARLAPGVFPNSSGISFGMNYTDYSDMEKAEHFSYPGMGNFLVTDSIPVYVDGTLLAGASPISEGNPEIRIAAFQPENTSSDMAWIKVENVGETAADMRYLALLDSSGTSFVLNVGGNAQNLLAAGDTMLICAGTPCSNGRAVPGISLGSAGELSLEYGSIMVDYVAWGSAGRHASVAVGNGLWRDSSDHLRTTEKVWGPSLPYESGSFFRRTNFDGHSTMDWIVFSPSEKGTAEGNLPNSVPFSWNDGVEIVLPHEAPMHFAWVPVPGALSYRLNIFSEDSVQIYQEETGTTYTDVNLPEGTYRWGVESSDKPVGLASWEAAPLKSARFRVSRLAESASYVEAFSLNVEPLAARKDTRLLVPNWGMYADIRGWDQSHVGNPHWDEEESHRCWAVGINELNRYFGGTLTQDEIKIHGKTIASNDSIFGAFPLGSKGAGPSDVASATLSWALGGVSVLYYDDFLRHVLIKELIRDSLPLYIVKSGHVMVVDGYRIRMDDRMEVHFLNPHNDGGAEWVIFSYGDIFDYIVYDKPNSVLNSDSLVDEDSDEDGVMDYDEIYRFHTNPSFWDSDSDSVGDKIEIWSYTMRENPRRLPASENMSQNPYNLQDNAQIYGNEREIYANIDGDSVRAELDKDSDNDGLLDGEEDLNGNGVIDEGETDPYLMNENQRPIFAENDIPGSKITLYSLGQLSLNDGSSCKREGSNGNIEKCLLASESKKDYYAVSLASSVGQSEVHSKGGVLLRNMNETNCVYLYYDNYRMPVLNVQKGASALAHIEVPEKNWIWSVNHDMESIDVGFQEKVVHSGETYVLTDKSRFKVLKVESGGVLQIGTGEMFIGFFQLESGAKIDFFNRGYKTILHVEQSMIWRGSYENVLPQSSYRMKEIARGFKMIYHGTDPLYIEGLWAGTIFAPNAKLVLGQANKTIYGRFVGNGITVHQYAEIYSIIWNPKQGSSIVYHKKEEK